MGSVSSLGRRWLVIFACVLACITAAAFVPSMNAGIAWADEVTSTDTYVDNPDNPGNPDGSDPADPVDPSDPGDASDPVNPDEPASPDDPKDPVDPDAPQDPANPADPDEPSTPEDPSDPDDAETPTEPEVSYEDSHTNMYRLYNPHTGEHFYTSSLHEATSVAAAGWQWEGIGWVAPLEGTPVYRLYNSYAGDHHYTTSVIERAHLISVGWTDEGIGWYSDGEDHTAVLRQYNPNAQAGAHNFTVSWVENDHLTSVGWNHEGISWYATNGPNLLIEGRWLVTNAWGSLERFWIGPDGAIVKGRFIEPEEGTGYVAYATDSGAVVRGKHYLDGDYVIVADHEGRVAMKADGTDGWMITDAYDGGMQRYYYIADHRAMRAGFFTVDGVDYYGLAAEGYVLRGKFAWRNVILLGNLETGALATGDGWIVTDAYDGGLQKYWLTTAWDRYKGAQTGIFTVDGINYFGLYDQGYVARNRYVYEGRWYTTDNDGVLSESVSPEEGDMMLRAQGMTSPTDFLILVDTNICRVGIFRGGNGNWNLDRFEPCVCGAPWSPTITGTYSTGYHLPVLPDWSNALYCTNITGGYFFHSVLSSTDELGQHLSHGCIRLDWPFAQHMQTVPYGSTVHLY